MIHGLGKNKIRHLLEELVHNDSKVSDVDVDNLKQPYSVAVVDGMAEMQMLSFKNVEYFSDLSNQFSTKILKKIFYIF